MMRALLYVVWLSFLAAAPAFAADRYAAGLKADIKSRGVEVVVRDLRRGKPREWQRVLSKIAAGSSDWLEIASAMRPGTDAGTGEALTGAVSRALLVNPAGVLSIIGEGFPVEHICTLSTIEPSDTQVRRFRSRAAAALKTVTNTGLQDKRQACSALVEQLR